MVLTPPRCHGRYRRLVQGFPSSSCPQRGFREQAVREGPTVRPCVRLLNLSPSVHPSIDTQHNSSGRVKVQLKYKSRTDKRGIEEKEEKKESGCSFPYLSCPLWFPLFFSSLSSPLHGNLNSKALALLPLVCTYRIDVYKQRATLLSFFSPSGGHLPCQTSFFWLLRSRKPSSLLLPLNILLFFFCFLTDYILKFTQTVKELDKASECTTGIRHVHCSSLSFLSIFIIVKRNQEK